MRDIVHRLAKKISAQKTRPCGSPIQRYDILHGHFVPRHSARLERLRTARRHAVLHLYRVHVEAMFAYLEDAMNSEMHLPEGQNALNKITTLFAVDLCPGFGYTAYAVVKRLNCATKVRL